MNVDVLLNDFATRSFRDVADGDYIAARMAYRSRLIPQFLWSSLQALEKYLKCVLVLNRVRAPKGHDLGQCLGALEKNRLVDLRPALSTKEFIEYLDTYGRHRYFESSYYTRGLEIMLLDRAVWDLRRYARPLKYNVKFLDGRKVEMFPHELKANEIAKSKSPHKFSIMGGHLEAIIADARHPAREFLLWQNAFFGRRPRKTVRLAAYMSGEVAPLFRTRNRAGISGRTALS